MIEAIYRIKPSCHQTVWGGTKLLTEYRQPAEENTCAESWVLSAHENGSATLESGEMAGERFSDWIMGEGASTLGTHGKEFERFPVLIKFIDAATPLSVQVHPDDAFAWEHEHEYGKTEMWLILQSEPGAFLYFGVEQDLSSEEVRRRAENGTLEDVLHKEAVHPGDVFFIKAGTIHAIGAGITLCEIQQNSNTTYRLYDYHRRDKEGHLRELHLDKALRVSCLQKMETGPSHLQPETIPGGGRTLLGQCRYFVSERYDCDTACDIPLGEDSFRSLVVISGEGSLTVNGQSMEARQGDSFYVPAQKGCCRMEGSFSVCVTRV